MTDPAPMFCPRCKAPMNHHAEKLVEPRDAEEAARMDFALGGLVEECYACPACGESASRPAVPRRRP